MKNCKWVNENGICEEYGRDIRCRGKECVYYEAREENVFTCPETDDLTGKCRLCGKGIEEHDIDFNCIEVG